MLCPRILTSTRAALATMMSKSRAELRCEARAAAFARFEPPGRVKGSVQGGMAVTRAARPLPGAAHGPADFRGRPAARAVEV